MRKHFNRLAKKLLEEQIKEDRRISKEGEKKGFFNKQKTLLREGYLS